MTRDKIKLPKIYEECGYDPEDIITKWVVDNRPSPSKGDLLDETPLPKGFKLVDDNE